jgi:hypothetical protein
LEPNVSSLDHESEEERFQALARNMPQMPAVVPAEDAELEQVEEAIAPLQAKVASDAFDDDEFVLAFHKQLDEPPVLTCGHLPIQEAAWLTVLLQDATGQPLADEPYRLVLSDGSVREGVTDSEGLLDLDDLEPGACTLTWPDLDAAELHPLASASEGSSGNDDA